VKLKSPVNVLVVKRRTKDNEKNKLFRLCISHTGNIVLVCSIPFHNKILVMKEGKTLNNKKKYPNVNIQGFTLNRDYIKSFFLMVNGTFDLSEGVLYDMRKKIGKTIKRNLNKELFHIDRVIEIEDVRQSKKLKYAGFEYTIFLLKENSLTIPELEQETLKLTDIIYETHFKDL
jgi:hypothetical protein